MTDSPSSNPSNKLLAEWLERFGTNGKVVGHPMLNELSIRTREFLDRASDETNELRDIVREVSTMDCFYTGAKCDSPDCGCLAARAERAISSPKEPTETLTPRYECHVCGRKYLTVEVRDHHQEECTDASEVWRQEKAGEPARELSPSESASFAKTLARSPRRVEPPAPLPLGFVMVAQCASCCVQDFPSARHHSLCACNPGELVRPVKASGDPTDLDVIEAVAELHHKLECASVEMDSEAKRALYGNIIRLMRKA